MVRRVLLVDDDPEVISTVQLVLGAHGYEVLAGGGTTITAAGAAVEVRGICRALTVTCSSAETVQFVGITGPITLNGTTTATFNRLDASRAKAE